ncbi:putative lipid II flippase FtsW [Arthrobacter sp. H35-D1]|uniref:putative lipid II flippase FtsW n=1 Tax=Arthrobacter sp. H35-D1 TaxID=3046202 RepID=UPI0024BB7E7F|nr:putative lipid II flippase FtsW [Arthrobacter sp. H35-D1]MDJ0313248.1 putative lipid II flippase FtsW [Arthrobacter sp. H35-D1]
MAKTPTQQGKVAAHAAQANTDVEAGKAKVGSAKTGTGKTGSTKVGLSKAGKRQKPRAFQGARNWFNARVGRPTAMYYWIIGTTVALTLIGRMTVLSASTAETISQGKDPYSLFVKESGFAVAGLALMFVLSCVPAWLWKRFAPFLFLLAIALLGLIFTPLGVDINGNLNWLELGPVQFQPSEAAKLALALWMGAVLTAKGSLVRNTWHVVLPVGVGGAAVLALILGGKDLGTAVIVGMMILSGLMFAGVRKWLLALALVGAGLVAAVFSMISSNRTDRFASWLGDCSQDGACDQYLNGVYALASGGWFGVGLGQSRQKWNWIPEAHNDFIFAIIGEEFGLLGTLVIVGLYGVLAFAIFRVVNTRNDPFSRITCGMILTWIIGQAVVNIAVVVGLLPVIGVPLPLISYGGTALIMVLAALGVVLSFSRTDPALTDAAGTDAALTDPEGTLKRT